MTEPETSDGVVVPEQRWQSSARWTLVAVIGVTLIGGLGFYVLFLRGEATPPPPARPVATTSTSIVGTVVAPTTVNPPVDSTVTTP